VIQGILGGLARWPMKSMAGERLRAARLDGRGLGGDRTHALLDAGDGRPRRDPAGQQDLERSVLVTTEASRRALEAALGRPVDLRRFRTNLHLELDAPAFAEERWQGGRLQVGDHATVAPP
jgi:uncharacterized protein YcbX